MAAARPPVEKGLGGIGPGLPAAAGLTVPSLACLLQFLYLYNNALTGTIPWNWTLPDSLQVSVRLQGQRACLLAWGRGCFQYINLTFHRRHLPCFY